MNNKIQYSSISLLYQGPSAGNGKPLFPAADKMEDIFVSNTSFAFHFILPGTGIAIVWKTKA